MTCSHTKDRILGTAELAWGAALLTGGETLWCRLTQRAPSWAEALAYRVLGVRHLAQGVSRTLAPGRYDRLLVSVDLLHAATMFALAAADPGRRRPALVSGSVAVTAPALTGVCGLRRYSLTVSACRWATFHSPSSRR